jgi:hypothetical protein
VLSVDVFAACGRHVTEQRTLGGRSGMGYSEVENAPPPDAAAALPSNTESCRTMSPPAERYSAPPTPVADPVRPEPATAPAVLPRNTQSDMVKFSRRSQCLLPVNDAAQIRKQRQTSRCVGRKADPTYGAKTCGIGAFSDTFEHTQTHTIRIPNTLRHTRTHTCPLALHTTSHQL